MLNSCSYGPPSRPETASCSRNDSVANFPLAIRIHPIEAILKVRGVNILGSFSKKEGSVNDGVTAATPSLTITDQEYGL